MKLIFATNNDHKLSEAGRILGSDYALLTPRSMGITEEIPEEMDTLAGNALQKARYIHERTRVNCFADDTGLEVEALGGAPGIRSARYAGDHVSFRDNMDLLLKNMEGVENRRARFRTVIALIYDGNEYLFEGEVSGEITHEPDGDGGFGYDPVFVAEGSGVSFARLDPDEKNSMSHRGRALAKLAKFLHPED